MKLLNFKPPRNIILSVLLLAAIAFTVVKIVFAVTPDPGHDFTAVDGGVAQGDILYGSAPDTLLALPKDTTAAQSRYLSNTGATNNPAWAQVNMTNGVVNALPVANGGTGLAAITLNNLIYGAGTSNVSLLAPGATTGAVLMNTAAGAPSWALLSALPSTAGALPLANGGSGSATGAKKLIAKGTLSAAVATSGTTETKLFNLAIPANSVAVGDTFRVSVKGVSSSTGTLIFRVRVGALGTTSDAQAWISTTSAAQVANAWAGFDVLVTVRSATTVQAAGVAHAGAVVLPQLIGAAATAAIVSTGIWYINIDATASVGTFTAHTAVIDNV